LRSRKHRKHRKQRWRSGPASRVETAARQGGRAPHRARAARRDGCASRRRNDIKTAHHAALVLRLRVEAVARRGDRSPPPERWRLGPTSRRAARRGGRALRRPTTSRVEAACTSRWLCVRGGPFQLTARAIVDRARPRRPPSAGARLGKLPAAERYPGAPSSPRPLGVQGPREVGTLRKQGARALLHRCLDRARADAETVHGRLTRDLTRRSLSPTTLHALDIEDDRALHARLDDERAADAEDR